MAFGKKGWRKIVVDDGVYYWQGAGQDYYEPQSFILWARPERQPHRLLTVRNDRCGELVVGAGGRISSGLARSCIEAAIASGWLDDRPNLVSVALSDYPQRHVILKPSWRTSTAIALAEGIYEDKAFDRLPILADALQDAGCEDADLLTHLRGDGPHVRGCWALDLVLGKE